MNMTSSVNSSTSSSSTRITGTVSGLDVDSLVKAALTADQAKIDKYKAKVQIDEWKIDAYREITSSIQSFYNTYFDPTSSTSLKSANTFASFTSTYGTTAASNYVSITANANANAGTYKILSLQVAEAAMLSGTNVGNASSGAEILDSSIANINSQNGNNVFSITLNGTTKQIALNEDGSLTTVEGLQQQLQTKINEVFGSGKITVGYTDTANGGQISFSTGRDTDAFKINQVYNNGASTLFGSTPTAASPVTLNAYNNKFDLTIGGVTRTVTVSLDGGDSKSFTSADDLAAAIQTAANDAFGGTADITFTNTDGKVTYTSDQTVSVGKSLTGIITALGLDNSNLSNKVNLTSKLSDISNTFGTALTTGAGNTISFTINGTSFSFDPTNNSIQDIINKVNSDTSVNATIKYDITSNSFSIKSNSTGVAQSLNIQDTSGNFMSAIGLTGTASGTDASVTISDGTRTNTIVRSSNSFTYDGLTFNIKQNYTSDEDSTTSTPDPLAVTISSDTTKTYEYLKGFVDKYNELIDQINTKLSEKSYRDYQPLTDDQKADMTQDQIDKWETKAKSGLLRNDTILSGLLSKFRTTLYASVEGAGISLSSIGITTSSDYTQKGKLEINETKLKSALETKSDQIAKLFTTSSDVSYYSSLDTSALRSQRYNESGIGQRLSDLIQDAIRTTTDKYGNKGSLLIKAGITGDRSEYTNLLYKEISDFEDTIYDLNSRLSDRENSLYSKYTAMETALNQLSSQQNSLASMFNFSNN
jgi:flagellar hook-associated protein 2